MQRLQVHVQSLKMQAICSMQMQLKKQNPLFSFKYSVFLVKISSKYTVQDAVEFY